VYIASKVTATAVSTFDTLKFAKSLKAAGMPSDQAEAQAVVMAEAFQLNIKDLTTKDDLKNAVDSLRHEISLSDQKIRCELALLKWMVGSVGLGIVAILV
jgi:2-phosphoglycerate kinase